MLYIVCIFHSDYLKSWLQTSNGDLTSGGQKRIHFQAIAGQRFVTGPKIQIHLQVVELESSVLQELLRLFCLDQLANIWTHQVYGLTTILAKEEENGCKKH